MGESVISHCSMFQACSSLKSEGDTNLHPQKDFPIFNYVNSFSVIFFGFYFHPFSCPTFVFSITGGLTSMVEVQVLVSLLRPHCLYSAAFYVGR